MEKDEENLNTNLKYWKKNDLIIQVKKGLYLLKKRYEQEGSKQSYLEYISNKIYEPSYLSTEYIMNKYGLLTEAVYNITSVTTKKTKIFKNKLGLFTYQSITPKLYRGFFTKRFNNAFISEAEKAKAVFDFLYLKFLKETLISEKAVKELRINWENMTKKEFQSLINYVKKSKSQRVFKLIKLIEKIYYA